LRARGGCRGNFSVVKKCRDRETSKLYALKIIDKKLVEGKEEMIETEVEILRRVKHPNIISMIEAFDTDDKLYLVMDLCVSPAPCVCVCVCVCVRASALRASPCAFLLCQGQRRRALRPHCCQGQLHGEGCQQARQVHP
jgi:hypothetical protein